VLGSNRQQWDFLSYPTVDISRLFGNMCLGDLEILDELLLSKDAEPADEDVYNY
jgi:hypothetical protein